MFSVESKNMSKFKHADNMLDVGMFMHSQK